jgi:DNA-binding MarR family transcriptional regulator
MGHPDLRHHSTIGADLETDSSGYLVDPAMRRAVKEMGDDGQVEILEALAALRLAAKQMHDAMESYAESQGLSESRLRVLWSLYTASGRQMPLGALADQINVTPRTMTDIIDVLERDGLVKRVPDPVDRRSIQAVMTEAGVARIKAMRSNALSRQAAIARGFTPEQLVQLRHLCLLLVRNLSDKVGA